MRAYKKRETCTACCSMLCCCYCCFVGANEMVVVGGCYVGFWTNMLKKLLQDLKLPIAFVRKFKCFAMTQSFISETNITYKKLPLTRFVCEVVFFFLISRLCILNFLEELVVQKNPGTFLCNKY